MAEFYSTPMAESISVKEIKNGDFFSIKDLKKAIENLDDNMLVTIQRVEDIYFTQNNNSYKSIKSLWDISKIGVHSEKRISEWLYDSTKCDPSLYELSINNEGKRVLKSYIDTIPIDKGYVSTEKGSNGEQVFVLTVHK